MITITPVYVTYWPLDTKWRPEGPSRKRRSPRLGGSLEKGGAERLEQAEMFSELSLLREDTVCRTPYLVQPHCYIHQKKGAVFLPCTFITRPD